MTTPWLGYRRKIVTLIVLRERPISGITSMKGKLQRDCEAGYNRGRILLLYN